MECSRSQQTEQWLWSFQPEPGCLRVAAVSPANISREEKREVSAWDRRGNFPVREVPEMT